MTNNTETVEHPCVEFLRKLAERESLEIKVFYPASREKPVVILSWIGTDPQLNSILLNSHMDVVPVFEEFWTHKPFEADIDDEGRIFARGSQDMKCVGMQYLGAIREMKRNNVKVKRTINISFVPDEEIFGPDGMKAFAKSKDFMDLNVGFLLDEGIASPNDVFDIFYGEKTCWHILFKIFGTPGHGSLLLKDTAADHLRELMDQIYDYREGQEKYLLENPHKTLGDVTTINVTQIHAGKQRNVLPPLIEMTVDCRIALTEDLISFEKMLRKWTNGEGKKIEIEFLVKEEYVAPTKTDDSNPFWKAFKNSFDDMNLKIKPQVFPAGTDASYIRSQGIPSIGFSPMNFTPILLHDHDEFLQADVYMKGIQIYSKILTNLSNV